MLYWALVEQVRHERKPDDYKDRYIVPILGLPDKHEATTVGSPTELVKVGKLRGQT